MLCKTVVTFARMVSPSKEALEKMHQYYDGMWGLLWLTLFALQNLGFWEFLRRKTNADFVFLLGITVVVQMSVLFVAGLLNVLPHVTVLLWVFGSFYIVYACWRDRSAAFLRKHYFTAESFLPLLYLILFSLIFSSSFLEKSYWNMTIFLIGGLLLRSFCKRIVFLTLWKRITSCFRNILLEVRRIYIVDAAGVTRPGIF